MARPPLSFAPCRSPQSTFCTGSSASDGTSSGRIPVSSASSATRAERFDTRTAENVATASTRVPPAVASEEIVCQSATEETLERRRRERVAIAGRTRLVAVREPVLTLGRRSVRETLGVHASLRLSLNPVVTDGGRGIESVVDVGVRELVDEAGVDRVFRPDPRITIGLQLESHGTTRRAFAVTADAP